MSVTKALSVPKSAARNSVNFFNENLYQLKGGQPVTPAKLASVMRQTAQDRGPAFAEAIQEAYSVAKKRNQGANPADDQITSIVDKTIDILTTDTTKGHVNDSFIDGREAKLVPPELLPVARAIFKAWTSAKFQKRFAADRMPPSQLKEEASIKQLAQAMKVLTPVVAAGFARFKAHPDDYQNAGPRDALRDAANAAKLSTEGRVVLLTAAAGAIPDAGNWPTKEKVMAVLKNAQTKIKAASGAPIVDFAHPEKAPTRRKNKNSTLGIEIERSPNAQGKTVRALHHFASKP